MLQIGNTGTDLRNVPYKMAQELGGRATDPLSLHLFLSVLPPRSSLLPEVYEAKGSSEREDLLTQAYQDIQTEAGNPSWMSCLWNGTMSEPTAPQNRCSTGIHAPELVHCLFFYNKDTLTCPFRSYRQSLHHCGCFSPLSSFLCPAGEKHCADCPVLTHMLE